MTTRISEYKATQPATPVESLKSATVDKGKVGKSAAGAAAAKADQVTLTDSARSLQKVAEAVANAPVVDTAKVAAVKQSIGAGTYQINPSRIADQLLRFEKGLK